MHKNTRLPFLLLTVVAALSCTSGKEKNNIDQRTADQVTAVQVNEYPPLTLKLSGGDQVSARELQGNNVFVLFQPDCSHCQDEAAQIEQRLEEFKDYTLYFISSAPMDEIDAFAQTYKLKEKKQVKFAWTSTEEVLDHYGAIRTPSVYIYSDGALKGSFNGQTDIQNIINAL